MPPRQKLTASSSAIAPIAVSVSVALQPAARAHPETVDHREQRQRRRRDERVIQRPLRQLEEIAGKSHRHRRHAAGLDDEQQHPAVNESHRRMQRLAQISVLPADDRQPRGQLRVNKSAGQRDQPARDPRPENERRSVDPLRDDVGIDENARADDAAHHRHRRAEQAELAGELAASFGARGLRRRFHARQQRDSNCW